MKSLKKLVVISIIWVVFINLFTVSLLLLAQDEEGLVIDETGILYGPSWMGGFSDPLKTKNLNKLTEELSLTQAQKAEIEDILKESEEKAKELEGKIKDSSTGPGKIGGLVEGLNIEIKIRILHQELRDLQKNTVEKINEILTDKQKTKLDDLLEESALHGKMESLRQALKLKENDSTIMPLVRKILKCQKDFNAKYTEKIKELEQSLSNKDENPDKSATFKVKQGEVKEILNKYNSESKEIEDKLKKCLTPGQQAILSTKGIFGGIPLMTCHYQALTNQRLKNFDKVITDLSEMIRIKPNSPSIYYWRGKIYVQLKEWTKALNDFTTVIKNLDPNLNPSKFAATCFFKGYCYEELGKTKEAEWEFLNAEKIDPVFFKSARENKEEIIKLLLR